MMEKELVPEEKRANFIETLDQVMLASPANWEKHYHATKSIWHSAASTATLTVPATTSVSRKSLQP